MTTILLSIRAITSVSMFLFVALCLLALTGSMGAAAHIGSPNVFFDGTAGSYPIRVVIRPPDAIPGRAEITVTISSGGATGVTVLPAPGGAPADALPAPDVARPVAGAAGVYSADLWIMTQSSYAIIIGVTGSQGAGECVVPLNAVNLAPPGMPVWIQLSLLALGVMLVAGVMLIAGAVAREARLVTGAKPAVEQEKPGTLAMVISGAMAVALIGAGWFTWQQIDRDYRNNQLFKSLPVSGAVQTMGLDRLLTLSRLPDDRGNRAWPNLVTDHGKLIHTYLIREPELDALAHIHPFRTESGDYAVFLPPLPEGAYRVYADITQENGLSQTLTTSVTIPAVPAGASSPDSSRPTPDPDDSWTTSRVFSQPGRPTTTCELQQGYRMVWENPEVATDPTQAAFRFSVQDAAGNSAMLEPYMGMMGHAVVRRVDGSVFAHLHPIGSISMASQELLSQKTSGSDSADMKGMDHTMPVAHDMANMNRISFPYQFPQTGSYRIWVQVKIGEQVMTGFFDASVTAIAGG